MLEPNGCTQCISGFSASENVYFVTRRSNAGLGARGFAGTPNRWPHSACGTPVCQFVYICQFGFTLSEYLQQTKNSRLNLENSVEIEMEEFQLRILKFRPRPDSASRNDNAIVTMGLSPYDHHNVIVTIRCRTLSITVSMA